MTNSRQQGQTKAGAPQRKFGLDDLYPIDELIPYNRRFLKLGRREKFDALNKSSGIMGKFGSNVKGLFGGFKSKEMERPDVVRLRKLVGDLKNLKAADSEIQTDGKPTSGQPVEAKSKKALLEEKKKSISEKAKKGKPGKEQIGLRIEVEKLKKKYSGDPNLIMVDAILTSRDGCLPYRSIEERVSSLSAALKESGQLVSTSFLTTYSIDVLFDIYFLYLETLQKLYLDRVRKLSPKESGKGSVAFKSIQRDIKLINLLLAQSKLKNTIANVAKKLNGFGYPFVSMNSAHVSKTYSAEQGMENERIGPGTVKLNKFLVRIYLSVMSQIPFFQPIASRICDALPRDYQCKIMIANVNIDNAYTQLKISKTIKASTIPKQTLALFLYGRQVVRTTIRHNASTPSEGRILLRTAEMAEEYAFMSSEVDPEIIKFGYKCATMAIALFKPEAESIIRRLFEIADIKKVDLRESSSESES